MKHTEGTRALLIELLGLAADDARDGATLEAMARALLAAPTPAVQKKKQPMPTYRGHDDPKTPSEFLIEVSRYAADEGLDRTVVMQQLLPAALYGGMCSRWWNFMGGFEDWDVFQEALQRQFGPVPVHAPWMNLYPKPIQYIPLTPPCSESNIVDVTITTNAGQSVDASEISVRHSEIELPPLENTSVHSVTTATSQDVPTTPLPLTPLPLTTPLILIPSKEEEEVEEEEEAPVTCSDQDYVSSGEDCDVSLDTVSSSERRGDEVAEQSACSDSIVQPAQQPLRQAVDEVASTGREGLLKDVSSCCKRHTFTNEVYRIPDALSNTMGKGSQRVVLPSWSSRVVLARERKPPDKVQHVIG